MEHVEFNHGHTFGGNSLSCAAAVANINEIKERDLSRKARESRAKVVKRLTELDDLGIIGDIRGKGLMVGAEFVANRKTKEQFPEGLRFRYDQNWIAFAPPIIVENDEIDFMMNAFSDSIQQVVAMTKSGTRPNPNQN